MKIHEVQPIIDRLYQKVNTHPAKGVNAQYIPSLAEVDPNKLGIFLCTADGEGYGAGDWNEKFSIQSITKVLSLALAFKFEEDKLWKRVGVEPSGTSYNSLILLELENGIPRNPFINAGAIVIADVLLTHLKNPEEEFIHFVRELASNEQIQYSEEIAASEKSVAYRNMALVNFMKSHGNIHNHIEDVMDFYFKICSVEMTCKEMAHAFLFFANSGKDCFTQQSYLSSSKVKRINAIMQLCGMYDESGEFAFKVGLPGKSGVGGGIVAVHPGEYSIAVWSPQLNKKGNSYKGSLFLEEFTTLLEKSIF